MFGRYHMLHIADYSVNLNMHAARLPTPDDANNLVKAFALIL